MSCVLIALALGASILLSPAYARVGSRSPAGFSPAVAKGAPGRILSVRTVKEGLVPAARPRQIAIRSGAPRALPAPVGGAAAGGTPGAAPRATSVGRLTAIPGRRGRTPPTSASFNGMKDSGSICPPRGCQPPDQALAASASYVLQGVNVSFALYETGGARVSGWPKTAKSFFAVPNPSPSGCAPRPYLTDPRAFYDPVDQRFWALVSQTEGIPSVDPGCDFSSVVWVAVSATSDPTGSWYVYSFDMTNGTNKAVDFPGFGFSSQALFISGNMFNNRDRFRYAEVMEANKAIMEAGGMGFTPYFFTRLTSGGVLVDSVQPVETGPSSSVPPDGYFVASYNTNGDRHGHDCFVTACRGVAIYVMSNPIAHDTGGPDPMLDPETVGTPKYAVAPRATQPTLHRVDSSDTRISATPVYQDGQIWAALTTRLYNGTATVPGTLWLQIDVTGLTPTLANHGYYAYAGHIGVIYPALMPDAAGNVIMVFDVSGATIVPSIRYVRKPATASDFLGSGRYLQKGVRSTYDVRWGDYSATSYSGSADDHVWIAAQYSPWNRDWATRIGRL